MTTLRKQIKQNAHRALSGSWGKAICIFMVALAIFIIFSLLQGLTTLLLGVPDFQDVLQTPAIYLDDTMNLSYFSLMISAVYFLFSLLINSPLTFGKRQWYYRLAGGNSDEVVTVFSFFASIRLLGKSIWHDIMLLARLLLWSIPFGAVPGGVCFFARLLLNSADAPPQSLTRLGGILLLLVGMLLGVLAFVFFLIVTNRYFLSAYLIVDRPEMSVREAFVTSVRYTKGCKTQIFMLMFSFLPWFLLSVLVLPLLYVVPYYNESLALYAKYLVERGKLHEPQEQTVQFHLNREDLAQQQEE